MEEIEKYVDKWLAATVFSEELSQDLEEKEISILSLLFTKRRLILINTETKDMIKKGVTILKAKLRSAVRTFLKEQHPLKTEAEEAACFLLRLIWSRTKAIENVSKKERYFLSLPEMKEYILVGQKKIFVRNNLFHVNIDSKVDLVTLDELLDCPHSAALDLMLTGKVTESSELKSFLALFGMIYEVKKYRGYFEEGMKWRGFQHSSHVDDQRVYYLIKFLEPAKEELPQYDNVGYGMRHAFKYYDQKLR